MMIGANLNSAAYYDHRGAADHARAEGRHHHQRASWAGRYAPSRVAGPSYSAAKHAMVDLTFVDQPRGMRAQHPRLA